MTVTLRTYVDNRFSDMKSERSSWVSHWKELTKFIEPRIGRFMTSGNDKGSKKNGAIINSTATYSLRVLAAGLMTGLTSPARPWFKVGLGDTALNDIKENRIWLDDVERVILNIFRGSNVYQSLQSIYEEVGLAGTGAMFVEQHAENIINTKTFTIGSYTLAIGADGRVNTFYREFRKTVGQLVEEYGLENCSTSTQGLYASDRLDQWIDVRQAIEPNRKRDNGSFLAKNKEISSLHWEVGANEGGPNDGFLRKSGFDEFPILGPRWDVKPSDIYGRSPAMDVLGDVKQLQSEERQKGKAIAKMVSPPMSGDSNINPSQTNTMPDGFTAVTNIAGLKSFGPTYQIDVRISELREDMNMVEQRIRRGMYEDLFLAITSLNETRSATEVLERKEEKLLMLGPVIERMQVELLDPLISRTFAIANRMGLIPEPPESIQGAELDIEYISPLAQAARAVATGGIERLGNYVANLANVDPQVLDKFDFDESVDQYARALGTSPKLIISDDDVAAKREQDAIAAQQARAVQASSGMVDSAKTLSETGTAGEDMVNQMIERITPS